MWRCANFMNKKRFPRPLPRRRVSTIIRLATVLVLLLACAADAAVEPSPPPPAAATQKPASGASSSTTLHMKGLDAGLFEGLAAMEAVSITAIERLDLAKEAGGYVVFARLLFKNSNPFPILIKEGRLTATFRPQESPPIRLGTIAISDILLNGISFKSLGETSVDTRVRFKGDIRDLRPLAQPIRTRNGAEDISLPLSVEGSLEVKVTVLSGLKIEKTIDVMLDYDPRVASTVLARFDQSLNEILGIK